MHILVASLPLHSLPSVGILACDLFLVYVLLNMNVIFSFGMVLIFQNIIFSLVAVSLKIQMIFCMHVLTHTRNVYQKIDFRTYYRSSKFHFHCFNILEVKEGGGNAPPPPGLNRSKTARSCGLSQTQFHNLQCDS